MTSLPYIGTPAEALQIAQHEADRMREHGLLPPLPTNQCACGAGCTDGVCIAQELSESDD